MLYKKDSCKSYEMNIMSNSHFCIVFTNKISMDRSIHIVIFIVSIIYDLYSKTKIKFDYRVNMI